MASELELWMKQAPFRMRKDLAKSIKAQADRLATAIKAEAPVRTGKLRDSIKVRRTRDDLTLYVTAGGDATASPLRRDTRYSRDVEIGGAPQTVTRGGPGRVVYDYVRALEFGTRKMPPKPFFYPVVRRLEPEIREAIDQAVAEALSR